MMGLAAALTIVVGAETAAADPSVAWLDFTRAAADADGDAQASPLLLGAAIAFARDNHDELAAYALTWKQTMLAFLSLRRLDAFKLAYGAAGAVPLDRKTFDASLRPYLATLAELRGAYFDRWIADRAAHPENPDDSLMLGAQSFANIEVGLRRQIAPDDPLGLADALVNRGLILTKAEQFSSAKVKNWAYAVEDYQNALALFDAARGDRAAMWAVDGAFASEELGATPDASKPREDFSPSGAEPYVPFVIMDAIFAPVNDAIDGADAPTSQRLLDLMRKANAQSEHIGRYLVAVWPCHPDLARLHYWNAVQFATDLKYSRQFPSDPQSEGNEFARARDEFIRALAISLHARGKDSAEFSTEIVSLRRFLVEAGKSAEVSQLDAALGSLGSAEVGATAPPAWRSVLDCSATR